MKQYDLPIEGLTCASCVTRVENIISKFDGVQDISVNLATERVNFKTTSDIVDIEDIAKAVHEYGYELKTGSNLQKKINQNEDETHSHNADNYNSIKKEFYFALILTIPVFIISMLIEYKFFQNIWLLSHDYTQKLLLVLTTPIMFVSGKSFFKIFWKNLKHFSFEMNSLVAIGTGSAYIYSVIAVLFPEFISINKSEPHIYFETAAVIITLILMGKLLEHRAKSKTTNAIKKLIELRPKTANIIKNDKEIEINISDLELGDVVIIKPGEKIPADGIIVIGNSTIDEAMITGESLPVERSINEKVIGGTINLNGSFNFRVTQTGNNSMLGQIIKLVEQAQATKPPIQKLVDKIAGIFVPVVIIIAIITFVGWILFSSDHSFTNGLINFIAVLIIACPCALGLATPTAIIVGTGLGASKGILIKNAESIESAHKISTVILDKTGTITEGKPYVTDIFTFDYNEIELVKIVASLESKSEHPIAKAIIEYANKNNINIEPVNTFMNHSGFGVTGIVNEKTVIVGKIDFLKDYSIKPGQFAQHYDSISAEGKTVICVAIEGELRGFISIEDKIKEDSLQAISSLEKMKIKTVMVTGDNFYTAQSIASKVGIKEFKAGVLPNEKANIVSKYQKENHIVAMVGDGINDAPALAQADVGIAIGTGTDIAIESSQITLVKGNLRDVVKAINLSKHTIKTIKQNLFWAFIYNAVLIPLAALGVLNPMIAALAMSFSSFSVVTNSLRLKRIKI